MHVEVLYRCLAALSSALMQRVGVGSDTWVTPGYVMEHLPLRIGHALCPAASLLVHFSRRSLDCQSRSIDIPTQSYETGKNRRETVVSASLKIGGTLTKSWSDEIDGWIASLYCCNVWRLGNNFKHPGDWIDETPSLCPAVLYLTCDSRSQDGLLVCDQHRFVR